jgi:hypothetical protein
MSFIGSIQNYLTLFDNLFRSSVMDILRSQKTDTGMVMLAIIPTEERLAE